MVFDGRSLMTRYYFWRSNMQFLLLEPHFLTDKRAKARVDREARGRIERCP